MPPDPSACLHPKGEPARIITSSGASHVFMRCVDCDNPVDPGHWLPHDRIYGSVEDVPVWRDYREGHPPCQHCGALGTELHHTSPRAIFGDEADDWPTIWLCRRCHGLWHVRMLREAHKLGGSSLHTDEER